VLGPQDSEEVFTRDALACQAVARERFSRHYRFWDAVMAADAELAIALAWKDVSDPATQQALIESYSHAIHQVTRSDRQINSVITQIELLASYLEHHGRTDRDRAAGLRKIASAIDMS
jgi:ribosomal protein S15P/S13E